MRRDTATRSARSCRWDCRDALLQPVADATGDLVQRYARTHGPFTGRDVRDTIRSWRRGGASRRWHALPPAGACVQGEFRPGGFEREWCGVDVLRTLRQRSLARLRKQMEPVEPDALGRLAVTWQGIARHAVGGLDALLDAVEQLQGAPLLASALERDVLPARIEGYDAGGPRSPDRGRRGDVGRPRTAGGARRSGHAVPDRPSAPSLAPWRSTTHRDRSRGAHPRPPRAAGASFFPALHAAVGGGFPQEVIDALWSLVWRGLVTNDSLHALRAYVELPERSKRRPAGGFRPRRVTPPSAHGRWSLLEDRLRRDGRRPPSGRRQRRGSCWHATACSHARR